MPKRKRGVDDTMSRPSSVINIPHDVVVGEILEKLPVQSLLRFRAVSKLWRRVIDSRRFQERHLSHQQKSQDPSILVCQPSLDDAGQASLRTLSLGATSVSLANRTFYPVHSKKESYVEITQSCDGLTCLYSKTSFIYVVNPATRWYRKLPEARLHALVRKTFKFIPDPYLGFGKDNVTGTYKIVWLYNSRFFNLGGQANTCEIFSFDTNNTWRHDVIVSCPHPILHDKVPAWAYGYLHWFIDAVTETQVLSLDLHTETFKVMEKVPVAFAPHHRITMCTLNNRLCLSEDKGDTLTTWSLNQDSVTWEKTYSIDLFSTLNCIEGEYLFSPLPIASLSANRLLLYDSTDYVGKLMIYNSRLKSCGKFFRARYYLGGVVSYSQSLLALP